MADPSSNRFSSLLLEGLDHYRRGRMLDAVRSWEEAYLLEPTNLRAREFLRSALERIHARMSASVGPAQPGVSFSEMQQFVPQVPLERLSGPGMAFRSFERHPWLRPPNETAPGVAPRPLAGNATLHAQVEAELNSAPNDEVDDAPAIYVPPEKRDARNDPGAEAGKSEKVEGAEESERREGQDRRKAARPVNDAKLPRPDGTDPYDLGGSNEDAADASRNPFAGTKRAGSAPGNRRTAPPHRDPSPEEQAAELLRSASRRFEPRHQPDDPLERTTQTPPLRSPWDDGPSVALPQSDPPPAAVATNAEVWKIHGPPSKPISLAPDETMLWMTASDELMALDDFSGALELVNKVLARHPEHARALAIRATCEQNLLQMYESRLGGPNRRPRVLLSPDEVIWLNLDPRAGFVLAQIDGQVTFEDLYAICGLTHLDTARILSQLLDEGVIEAVGELNHLF